MYTEFAAECAEDDPMLVVPWAAAPDERGETLGKAFVDLRADPWAFENIPEAELHPALLQALRALNAPRSPVFTAKCDAWTLDPDELVSLSADLLAEAEMAYGFASYLDLLWRDRTSFASFHQTEQLTLRLLRLADALDLPHSALRCVVRPALVDFDVPAEGFALTLYISALGYTPADAYGVWGESLLAAVQLMRGRDFRGKDFLRGRDSG